MSPVVSASNESLLFIAGWELWQVCIARTEECLHTLYRFQKSTILLAQPRFHHGKNKCAFRLRQTKNETQSEIIVFNYQAESYTPSLNKIVLPDGMIFVWLLFHISDSVSNQMGK